MNILSAIILVIVVYTYLIKFFSFNTFISDVNPYFGGIMETLNKYTGANIVYNLLASKGVFGSQKKTEELEREFIFLSDKLDAEQFTSGV
jgi:hypothetical protein